MSEILASFSLTQSHELAQERFGKETPSLITLKRWSASGRLDQAKTDSIGGSKPKYKLPVLFEIIEKSIQNKQGRVVNGLVSERYVAKEVPNADKVFANDKKTDATNSAQTLSNHEHFDEAINKLKDEIIKSIRTEIKTLIQQALESVQSDMLKSINQIDDIRKTLMTRYDNEAYALRTKINDLEEANLRLKNSTMESSKISIQLSRIMDSIGQLRQPSS